ncbi:hypothetical protein EVAR_42898_1 [Eumeta japonica]|uniref:Uncharacterized protein n=1 Tax=Eumeta variegata TaxID=151549 RepID=A0A4C1WTI6_EUMVA|nr:hypothetical protein EVAR_42898_1 [Eumeta japonica]
MRKRLCDFLLTRFEGAVYYGIHFDPSIAWRPVAMASVSTPKIRFDLIKILLLPLDWGTSISTFASRLRSPLSISSRWRPYSVRQEYRVSPPLLEVVPAPWPNFVVVTKVLIVKGSPGGKYGAPRVPIVYRPASP